MTSLRRTGRDHATASPKDADATEGSAEHLTMALDRSARGDVEAFECVYDHTAGPVLGITTRMLRNPAIAEEVAQDVMVEVWRTAARYDPRRGSPRTWIMTMAHARAVDRVRREQSASQQERRAASRDLRRPYDDVGEKVEANLEVAQVRRCLQCLSETQHEAIRLAYYDGYTYPEIAQLLASPLSTIKTRIRDAVTKLRRCMAV